MTATAEVRFGPDSMDVNAFVRLSETSYLRCSTYPDSAPILSVTDTPLHIMVTVPDPEKVTDQDVRLGRELAETAAAYAAALEHRLAVQDAGAAA